MMIAIGMPMILGFGAVAVDLGSVYLTTRHLQGVADMAALAAASDLTRAQLAAQATADANPMDAPVTAQTTTGVYSADGSIAPGSRFVAGGAAPSAAQVTLHGQASLFFGGILIGRPSFDITRTATAARAQLASFSIGSGLLSVNGGIENALLSALTGSTVSLSAMDYNALVTANVDLFDYVAALRTRLSLQGASYSQVLSTKVSSPLAMQALADVLTTNGQTAAAAAARTLAAAESGLNQTDLSLLIAPGPYGGQDHVSSGAGAKVSLEAMDVANALLTLANGGRQVQLDLGASIPGLASTTVYLAIGQRPSNSPWIGIDDAGKVIVRTAQARLYVNAQVGAGGVLGGLGASLVNLPVYVELASAQAKLSALSCANNTVSLSVAPSVGRIAIGQVNTAGLDDFTTAETISPATLLNLGLVKATATSVVDLGGAQWQTVNFSSADVAAHTIKTASTQDLAQTTVASLVGNAQVGVQVLGLGLVVGQGPVTTSLGQVLSVAAVPLDSTLNALESLLGVQLGYADVRINGLRCNGAALVA